MKTWHVLGQVLKASEGGITQKEVQSIAKLYDFKVRFEPSPLVGHYQISVDTQDQRKRRALARILWGVI